MFTLLSFILGAEFLTPGEISAQYFHVADTDNDQLLSLTEIIQFSTALGAPIGTSALSLLQNLCAAGETMFTVAQWDCALNAIVNTGAQGFKQNSQLTSVIPTTSNFSVISNRRNLAYASGAHLVSTDHPVPPFLGL